MAFMLEVLVGAGVDLVEVLDVGAELLDCPDDCFSGDVLTDPMISSLCAWRGFEGS